MRLLDGRAIAADLGELVGKEAAALREAGVVPTLAVVLPGDDPAARSYVRVIERAAERVGVAVAVEQPAAGTDPSDAGELLLRRLDELAGDRSVHGVMVQTPLPPGLRAADAGSRIATAKDVDGMNPLSAGRVALGLPGFAPATAAAVLEILHRSEVPLRGARAVVIGRSAVVGKPAALLLLAEDATVTVCHSKTADLPAVAREADVLVVAIGRARMVDASFVKPGATVIDVGTNYTDDGMVGDVDATSVEPVAGALTPVPGGVGPVTTMLLLRNTVLAARERQSG